MSRQDNWKQFAGKDQEDWPFAVGEVTGVRAWRLCDHGCLHPLHVSQTPPWTPGVNTATCVRTFNPSFAAVFGREMKRHRAPDETCACGFYAYFAAGQPSGEMAMMMGIVDEPGRGLAFGTIRGWGHTVVGTQGFRCEKAEITSLFIDPDTRWANVIRGKYPDVPLARHHDFELLSQAYWRPPVRSWFAEYHLD